MVYSNKWDSKVSSEVDTIFLNANCEDEVEDISSFSSCSSSITADLIASRNQSSQSPLQYDKNISEFTDSDSSSRKVCPQYSSKATTRRGGNDLLDEFTALVVKVQTTGIRAASWEAGELLYDAVLTILIKHGA
jgi:CCR4-NOT transcriptional regulation complex NOT5 subunit